MTSGEQKLTYIMPPISPELGELVECRCFFPWCWSWCRETQHWRPSHTRRDWRDQTGNWVSPPSVCAPALLCQGRAGCCQHRWSSPSTPECPGRHSLCSADRRRWSEVSIGQWRLYKLLTPPEVEQCVSVSESPCIELYHNVRILNILSIRNTTSASHTLSDDNIVTENTDTDGLAQ